MRVAVPWVAVAVAMVALYAMRGARDVAVREADEATDSILKLAPVVVQLRAESDSLRRLSLTADTVLVAVTDTVRVEIARYVGMATASADSLRQTLDSAQAVHLGNLESAHTAEVAAVWRIADERLAWGNTWRDYALTVDSLAQVQRATINQYAIANRALRGVLGRQVARRRVTEVLTMLGVAYVAVDALR